MTEPFGEGENAEVFKYSLFLVLCNRLTSCAVAVFGLVVSIRLQQALGGMAGQEVQHRAC